MVYLKNIIWIGLCIFSISMLAIHCNSNNVDCSKCYYQKPDSVNLILDLTINDEFKEVPVLLYKGNMNTGEFIDTFFCWKNHAEIVVRSEQTYSAKAIYKTNDRTVFVVDGVKQKLKEVTDVCSDNCWTITNNELNLELKY